MKKLFTLVLMVLYFTASSGVVLNVHYCMGKVSSVKIDNFNTALCKCGKKETGNSCCKSELKVAKMSTEHKATVAPGAPQIPVALLPTQVSLIDLHETNSVVIEEPVANAPPLVSRDKKYIINCVFRI